MNRKQGKNLILPKIPYNTITAKNGAGRSGSQIKLISRWVFETKKVPLLPYTTSENM